MTEIIQALLAGFGKSIAVGVIVGLAVNSVVQPTTDGGWWLLLIISILLIVIINAAYQAIANRRWWSKFK